MAKNYAGIDFGHQYFHAVEIFRGMGEIKLVRHDLKPIPDNFHSFIYGNGEGSDEGGQTAEISNEIKEWFQPHVRAFTSIPPDRLFQRVISFPFKQPKRISQLIKFEAEGSLPFSIEDCMIEHFASVSRGKNTDVSTWIIERDNLKRMLDRLGSIGLDPAGLAVEGLCLSQLSLAQGNGYPSCHAWLDIGATGTLFLVVNNGRPLLLRRMGFGGDDLSKALAREFNVSFEEGERIKLSEGLIAIGPSAEKEDKSARIASCLNKTIVPLIKDIRNTLHYIERHVTGESEWKRVREILLCGGTANLAGLGPALTEMLDVPSRVWRIPEEWRGEAEIEEKDHALIAEPLALALQNSQPSHAGAVNFRRGEFAYRVESKSFRKKMIMPAILVALIILVSIMRVFVVKSRTQQEVNVIRARMAESLKKELPSAVIADPLKQVRQLLMETQSRAEKYKDFTSATALDVLSAVSGNISSDLWLEVNRFSYTESQARIEGDVQGFPEAKAIVDALSSLDIFEKVELEDTRTAKDGKVNFVIQISLKKEDISP